MSKVKCFCIFLHFKISMRDYHSMKSHLINRSLLVLILSSGALVAATPVAGVQPVDSVQSHSVVMPTPASAPIQMPLMSPQGTAAIAMPGVFTERDAGTPVSIPMNGRFRLSLRTDSKVDPVGSFWRPVFSANQNFQFLHSDKTTNNWFNQEGSEHQVSSVFFAFKPLVIGQTELSFELVQWVPAASGSANASGPAAGDVTVIRTVTFHVTVVDADEASSVVEPAHQRFIQDGAQSLTHDLSAGSW